jgi:cell division protease FtsH
VAAKLAETGPRLAGGRPGEKGKEGKDLLHGDLGARIEEKLTELLKRTNTLVTENRGTVLTVAHALDAHKTLTGDDVQAVIEGRPGPLIDGRVYATPEFLAEAEAYHQRVVEAHRRHSAVEVSLPVTAEAPQANGSEQSDGQSSTHQSAVHDVADLSEWDRPDTGNGSTPDSS